MSWYEEAVERVSGSEPDRGTPPAPGKVAEVARYLRTETLGGTLLLVAAAIALIWMNSPWGDAYVALRDFRIGPAAIGLDLTVGTWAKDGLLAIFFFVIGLELKRELVIGELNDRKTATLPAIAALGGMLVPACLALAVSWGAPGAGQAWAIPVATDIAFALAVLALTGSGLPGSLRIFLLSLAVVDDLGAILVIAILFISDFQALSLAAAIALCGLYWWLQHRRIRSSLLYVPLGLLVWYAVHESGIHATIAGVALGLLTRVKADEDESEAPALRLEHRLQPLSASVALPVFALFAAGVPIGVEALSDIATNRVAIGVIVGLLVGKLIGILGFSWLAVRVGLAVKPRALEWRDLAAAAMLCGVGFTVSLLIAELSLTGDAAERAKAAVLLASTAAALLGAAALRRRGRAHQAG
ncbi:MAG: Na+/H+ antiporter NhaA [Pseudonocardiaceae bacterium]|nr:Na+/H+ antiporter NhaA [Pseudonocardiaceae bacterium]